MCVCVCVFNERFDALRKMSNLLTPTILLLREGTDTSQGVPQIVSNINACAAVVDTIRTTLGPRGMDKLIYGGSGEPTISNDGATIMRLLEIVHPAAQTLVDIARSQDEQVGDGTTSVVVLAGELLQQAKEFVEENVAPNLIVRGFRTACDLARAKVCFGNISSFCCTDDGLLQVEELAVRVDTQDPAKMREMLELFAGTSMNSKLIAGAKVLSVLSPRVLCPHETVGVLFQDGGGRGAPPRCRRQQRHDWREEGEGGQS